MRRQISQAILFVAVLIVVGLGLPLAVVVQQSFEDRAVADLQRRAAETIVEIALPLDPGGLAEAAGEPDVPGPFTVYDASAYRLFGEGPAVADPTVLAALDERTTSQVQDDQLVLAAPITDRSSESIVGALRVTQSTDVADGQVRRAWAAMGLAVVVALAGAAAVARAQGRRLAAPVARLAEQAEALGAGDFVTRAEPSGIAELDTVGDALAGTAERLATLLARERSFSADVSHQLRTPLTGLRLRLERLAGSDAEIAAALAEVARMEATVEHLLELSRDRLPIAADLDLLELLTTARTRWTAPFLVAGRTLEVAGDDLTVAARGSTAALGQVLDVLISNGLAHGAGTVQVRARPAAGGLVLEVSDDGDGVDDDDLPRLFQRHEGTGHGIGLALARSLTEAEGGRLLLAAPRPPCFHVVLAAASSRTHDLPTANLGMNRR